MPLKRAKPWSFIRIKWMHYLAKRLEKLEKISVASAHLLNKPENDGCIGRICQHFSVLFENAAEQDFVTWLTYKWHDELKCNRCVVNRKMYVLRSTTHYLSIWNKYNMSEQNLKRRRLCLNLLFIGVLLSANHSLDSMFTEIFYLNG